MAPFYDLFLDRKGDAFTGEMQMFENLAVGKSARNRFPKITPATPASIARHLCDAQNVGRNLSKASSPPACDVTDEPGDRNEKELALIAVHKAR